MPKRNKLPIVPDYIGLPKDYAQLLVQKSQPLQTLSETDMTLTEFKILDAYLSRIDSHNADKRYVRFERGELEKILGVVRITKDDLSQRLDNLFQVVTIKDKNKENGFTKISLFEKAEAKQDENGLWQVDLACTESALEYVFNIENIGYLRYRLKNIIDLTSRYSYVLYLYLEDNRFRKSWTVSLKDLKKILNCNAERYDSFKYFNAEILKKSQKELESKTNLRFSFEPTDKKGRYYTAIKFTIGTLADGTSNDDEEQTLDTNEEYKAYQVNNFGYSESNIEYGGELANFLGDVACENEFTPQQIRVIQDLVIKVVGHDHLECCDYLIHKMHLLNYHKAKNRYNYLIKMLNNDIKNPDDMQ